MAGNRWLYDDPTDKARRIYKDQVAFDELSLDEQGKDADMREYVRNKAGLTVEKEKLS